MHDDGFEFIVIGAGIGGLMCAATLSRAGRRVLVLEQHALAGGYCTSFRRKGHALDAALDTVCGLRLGSVFDEGLGLLDRIKPIRLDPIREVVLGERRFVIPASMERHERELIEAFPSESESIPRFFQTLARLAMAVSFVPVEKLWEQPSAAVMPEFARFHRARYRSLLDAHFHDELLKDVLSERCVYLGLPPEEVSAVTMAAMLVGYFQYGAYRVEGGFQRLADALVDVLRENGAVRLRSRVGRIVVEGGRAVGVTLDDGTAIRTEHVVCGGDLLQTVSELLPSEMLDGSIRSAIERRSPSHSFMVVHYSIVALPAGFGHVSSLGFYPGGSVAEAFRWRGDPADDPHIHIGVSVPTTEDSTLAPPGRSIVMLHYLCPSDLVTDWSAEKDRLARALIDRVGRWRSELVQDVHILSVATPHTLYRYTLNTGGAAYGWAATPQRYRDIAEQRQLGIEGLSLVGHWTDYGPGVFAAATSGVVTARSLLNPRNPYAPISPSA
jgi:phytoene dehydrogenase-like protein